MKPLRKDKTTRLERERLKAADSVSSSFQKGFLRGIGAPAYMIMPPVSASAYKGRGLAGDWEKIGGDLWSAMEDYSSKK